MNKVNGGADEPRKQGHTAGPWSVDSKESVGLYFIPEVESAQGRVTCFENKYDAALIAAAPLLKTMLERLLDEIMMDEAVFSKLSALTLEQAMEAISKAETV